MQRPPATAQTVSLSPSLALHLHDETQDARHFLALHLHKETQPKVMHQHDETQTNASHTCHDRPRTLLAQRVTHLELLPHCVTHVELLAHSSCYPVTPPALAARAGATRATRCSEILASAAWSKDFVHLDARHVYWHEARCFKTRRAVPAMPRGCPKHYRHKLRLLRVLHHLCVLHALGFPMRALFCTPPSDPVNESASMERCRRKAAGVERGVTQRSCFTSVTQPSCFTGAPLLVPGQIRQVMQRANARDESPGTPPASGQPLPCFRLLNTGQVMKRRDNGVECLPPASWVLLLCALEFRLAHAACWCVHPILQQCMSCSCSVRSGRLCVLVVCSTWPLSCIT